MSTDRPEMSNNHDLAEVAVDPVARKSARIKLLTIIALFGIPLLLAGIWLQIVRSQGGQWGSTSRGELIVPAVPMQPFAFSDAADERFDETALRGIWTLLYVPTGDCEDTCQRNLYHMRQVRLALNHRKDRVQRAVLAESPTQLSAVLQSEHPGLQVLLGDTEQRQSFNQQIDAAQAALSSSPDAIYLIDPFGNLMMRFAAELPPKSMLKDIKHLLKVSRIG